MTKEKEMVLIVWVNCEGSDNNKALPRVLNAQLVCMSDDMEERETIVIAGRASETACNEEVLRDWREVFNRINGLPEDSGQKLLIFPRTRHRTRFNSMNSILQKAEGAEGCNATHYATLGDIIVTNGEKLDAEAGIAELKRVLKQLGKEGLAESGHIKDYKARRPAREGIFSCKDYSYYGDLATKLYHLRTCEQLDEVEEGKLRGLGKNPEKKGWMPCPQCIKVIDIAPGPEKKPVKTLAWEKQYEARRPRTIPNRAETIKREIASVCAEYGMHAGFVGGTAFITTVVGEWFFTYNDRPISLHHKNYSNGARQVDRAMNFYHLQDKKFASPLHVLRYISAHDHDLKRRVMQEADEEMAEDRYIDGDTELDIVSRAVIFAARIHGNDNTGDLAAPYILHLMEAAMIAASMTDDQEVIAATILHGIIDDGHVKPANVQLEFGARIYKLVMSASEKSRPDIEWGRVSRERKSCIIEYLFSAASSEERMIALADKLSTLRAIRRRYQAASEAMWTGVGRGREEQAWYYKGLRDALGRLQDTDAWKEFSSLVDVVFSGTVGETALNLEAGADDSGLKADARDPGTKPTENAEDPKAISHPGEGLFLRLKEAVRRSFGNSWKEKHSRETHENLADELVENFEKRKT